MPHVHRHVLSPFPPLLLIPSLLSIALLLLSFASVLLHFRLDNSSFSTPLWPVRLLLPFFASLWSLSNLFLSCNTSVIVSQAIAQPAFLSLLYFLIRSSTHPSSKSAPSSNFFLGFFTAGMTTVPILSFHALLRYVPGPEFVPVVPIHRHDGPCAHPYLATALLAVFCAVYVPMFLNVSLGATAVVINKRLKVRIYGLAVVVIGALLVQVVALALCALWSPGEQEFRWLSMIAVAAFVVMACAAEIVLVVWPVVDAIAVGKIEESSCEVRESEGDEEHGSL